MCQTVAVGSGSASLRSAAPDPLFLPRLRLENTLRLICEGPLRGLPTDLLPGCGPTGRALLLRAQCSLRSMLTPLKDLVIAKPR